jgi:plastocyanin domain-containing protein
MKMMIISMCIAILLIGGAFVASRNRTVDTGVPVDNVRVVDGVQIIEIDAKGGYFPRRSVARAGIPTVLRFNTSGTFDCSAAVRIPSMNISKTLAQSGSTDIDIGIQATSTFKGTCAMGMYPFEVDFN